MLGQLVCIPVLFPILMIQDRSQRICSWKPARALSHAKQWADFIFLNKYFIEIQRNKRNLIHEIYVCLNDSQHNLFQLNIYFNIFLDLKISAHSSVSVCIISPLTDVKMLGTVSFFSKVGIFPFQCPLHEERMPLSDMSPGSRGSGATVLLSPCFSQPCIDLRNPMCSDHSPRLKIPEEFPIAQEICSLQHGERRQEWK